MDKISGGELVVRQLINEGIEHATGLIGYYVSPIFYACSRLGFKVIDTRHEQGAIHIADGYAEASGKVGTAIVTGGPGFANAVSGIIKSYKAANPILVIVGGFEPSRRDVGGLEDMDQLTLVKSYTKWCASVHDTKRIPEYIAMAIRYAVSGRKGPVVLEIPIDILRNDVFKKEVVWPNKYRTDAKLYGDYKKIEETIDLLGKAKKPIILAGNQVVWAKAEKQLLEFVELTGVPIFTINDARGSISDEYKLCFGSGRTIEGGCQLYAYKNADLVIALGIDLDYQISFAKVPIFNEHMKFIQVDRCAENIGFSSRTVDVGLVGDCDVILKQFNKILQEKQFANNKYAEWYLELGDAKHEYDLKLKQRSNLEMTPIHPMRVINEIEDVLSKDRIVVLDGSNAMFWGCSQFKSYISCQQIIGPNATYGQMGTGLPTAIGAKLANKDKCVLLYTGDGSFGFNIMEINTAIRFNIPLIIVVHNDSAWGFCKETQRTIYGQDCCGYGTELGLVRYDKLVEDLGGYGEFVETVNQIRPAIKRALESGKVACINIVTAPIMSPGANFLNGTVES